MQLFLRFFLFFGLCTFLCGKGRGEAPLAPAKTPASGVSSSLEFQVEAPQAILYDMLTETVLFEKDADQIMPPSSMTKMLLIYLLFEKLSKGEISLSDTFTVSKKAWRMGGSKMFVPLGEKVSLSDLLQGIIVQSGNDACVV
ncbi:MAG: D-alanyl-D-alanine carboxypeptidase family protein, partial [Holosporales bacterium]